MKPRHDDMVTNWKVYVYFISESPGFKRLSHTCEYCPQTFKQDTGLMIHMNLVHNGGIFRCHNPPCNTSTSRMLSCHFPDQIIGQVSEIVILKQGELRMSWELYFAVVWSLFTSSWLIGWESKKSWPISNLVNGHKYILMVTILSLKTKRNKIRNEVLP